MIPRSVRGFLFTVMALALVIPPAIGRGGVEVEEEAVAGRRGGGGWRRRPWRRWRRRPRGGGGGGMPVAAVEGGLHS